MLSQQEKEMISFGKLAIFIEILDQLLQLLMIALSLTTAFILLVVFIYYKFYLKPRKEIQRYLSIFRNLGYRVYEMPFTFMGLSFVTDFQKGVKLHKDALYFERTVYPQVDIAIGNVFDKCLIEFVNPDLIKNFLSGQTHLKYPKYELCVRGQKAILGEGVIFAEGEIWKHKRKFLSKLFNFQLLKQNIPKMNQICDRAIDLFEERNKVGENKFKYSLLQLSGRMFSGIIMKCFFGTDHMKEQVNGKTFEEFVGDTMVDASALTLNPLVALFGKIVWNIGLTKQMRKTKRQIELLRQKSSKFLKEVSEQVLANPKTEKNSFLVEAVIKDRLQNKENATYLDKDLLDQFQTFLVAGTDSTARFLTMMIYHLVKNPEKLNKLRGLINQVIKPNEPITYQHLKALPYLDWVLLQTTRVFGPGTGIFPRLALNDDYIKDIPICKDTVLCIQPRGNHYNQNLFRNANEFRPQRWEKECQTLHPYALIGFSSGQRTCIGKQLSYLQAKIGLIKLLQRYETIQVPDQVTLRVVFVYEPDNFDIVWTKRTQQA